MIIESCPFCGKIHEHMLGYSNPIYAEIVCDTCGAVAITVNTLDRIYQNSKEKNQLIQLLNEKNVKDRLELGIAQEFIAEGQTKDALLTKKICLTAGKDDKEIQIACPQYSLDDFLKRYPQTTIDKLNRTLCNIGRIQSLPNTLNRFYNIPQECFWTISDDVAQYYAEMLINAGFCEHISIKTLGRIVPPIQLTLEGWKKFEELEKNWQNSTTAFIAMWFNNATEKYRDAVKEAIRQAGYEPKVIDDHEHNNFIMDEVINQINEAKFVIADFTCIPEQPESNSKIPGGVRGGVYFEAGYAKGLGKEVIVTCKDDDVSKKRRHFDIDQLNTLFWNEKNGTLYDCNGNNFVLRLAERIKATVGKGKLIN